MTHIYNAEVWESNGRYYVGDVSALSAGSNKWWYQPRIFQLSPVEFVKLMIEKYNATIVGYRNETAVLIFYFTSLVEARKYKNDLNKLARDRKYFNY